jgi:GT2 family glycosyltransferase
MLEAPAKEPVYIIIPVHNRINTTLACLQHLQKCGDLQKYYVVIVDDGSTDGTAEAIHTLYPEVIVLPGNGDLWWTGAIAKGMEYAHEQKAEYFIWLNDDCLPDPGTLPQLLEFLKNHPDSIAAPTCYVQQDNLLVQKENGAKGQKAYTANRGEIVEVDSMSGWCVGVPVSVFRKIGSPDARKFPHYCGDDMYILKATRSGFKAYLLGDLRLLLVGIVHENISFQKYFRPHQTVTESFQALFVNKKSPYRLVTKLFYFTERYGLIFGIFLFLSKLTFWITEITGLYLNVLLNRKLAKIETK